MDKELKIVPPEGYEIDKENSTLECIKFKPITKKWRDDKNNRVTGYFIERTNSSIIPCVNGYNIPIDYCVFNTEKQAKSALAMARISQIMANDERFGGIITDEEWKNDSISKYCIDRQRNEINKEFCYICFSFLAFHTAEQRDLFLRENEDLVKDYLMLT